MMHDLIYVRFNFLLNKILYELNFTCLVQNKLYEFWVDKNSSFLN